MALQFRKFPPISVFCISASVCRLGRRDLDPDLDRRFSIDADYARHPANDRPLLLHLDRVTVTSRIDNVITSDQTQPCHRRTELLHCLLY